MIQTYKKEIQTLFIIFIFKIVIISLLPLTGDEAYFIKWAHNLSSGYYDHPPMIGWLLYILSLISDNIVFFRLFSVITTFSISYVIYKTILLLEQNRQKALYISFIFLASPIDILLSLITNDIALVFFGSLGTLFLLKALEEKNQILNSILAGVFLGFAFLSKYFAAFLMLSLVFFLLITYKKRSLKSIVVVSLVVFVFIAQNLYFNYNSCWNNIIFNFFARTKNSHYGISNLLGYIGLLVYIMTPWGIYYLYRSKFQNSKLLKLTLSVLGLILSVFFIVSLKNKIGLHWFTLFSPFMFMLFYFVDEDKLKKLFFYNAKFTYIHIFVVMLVLLIPISTLKSTKYYPSIILFTNHQKICDVLDTYNKDEIYSFSYTTAAMLDYSCKTKISVLFSNSKYGRMDDKTVDVRKLKKDILIFNKSDIDEKRFKGVCSNIDKKELDIMGAKFYLAECKDFDYEIYKEKFLKIQNKKFYTIPDFLPIGDCYFKERYFGGER